MYVQCLAAKDCRTVYLQLRTSGYQLTSGSRFVYQKGDVRYEAKNTYICP